MLKWGESRKGIWERIISMLDEIRYSNLKVKKGNDFKEGVISCIKCCY